MDNNIAYRVETLDDNNVNDVNNSEDKNNMKAKIDVVNDVDENNVENDSMNRTTVKNTSNQNKEINEGSNLSNDKNKTKKSKKKQERRNKKKKNEDLEMREMEPNVDYKSGDNVDTEVSDINEEIPGDEIEGDVVEIEQAYEDNADNKTMLATVDKSIDNHEKGDSVDTEISNINEDIQGDEIDVNEVEIEQACENNADNETMLAAMDKSADNNEERDAIGTEVSKIKEDIPGDEIGDEVEIEQNCENNTNNETMQVAMDKSTGNPKEGNSINTEVSKINDEILGDKIDGNEVAIEQTYENNDDNENMKAHMDKSVDNIGHTVDGKISKIDREILGDGIGNETNLMQACENAVKETMQETMSENVDNKGDIIETDVSKIIQEISRKIDGIEAKIKQTYDKNADSHTMTETMDKSRGNHEEGAAIGSNISKIIEEIPGDEINGNGVEIKQTCGDDADKESMNKSRDDHKEGDAIDPEVSKINEEIPGVDIDGNVKEIKHMCKNKDDDETLPATSVKSRDNLEGETIDPDFSKIAEEIPRYEIGNTIEIKQTCKNHSNETMQVANDNPERDSMHKKDLKSSKSLGEEVVKMGSIQACESKADDEAIEDVRDNCENAATGFTNALKNDQESVSNVDGMMTIKQTFETNKMAEDESKKREFGASNSLETNESVSNEITRIMTSVQTCENNDVETIEAFEVTYEEVTSEVTICSKFDEKILSKEVEKVKIKILEACRASADSEATETIIDNHEKEAAEKETCSRFEMLGDVVNEEIVIRETDGNSADRKSLRIAGDDREKHGTEEETLRLDKEILGDVVNDATSIRDTCRNSADGETMEISRDNREKEVSDQEMHSKFNEEMLGDVVNEAIDIRETDRTGADTKTIKIPGDDHEKERTKETRSKFNEGLLGNVVNQATEIVNRAKEIVEACQKSAGSETTEITMNNREKECTGEKTREILGDVVEVTEITQTCANNADSKAKENNVEDYEQEVTVMLFMNEPKNNEESLVNEFNGTITVKQSRKNIEAIKSLEVKNNVISVNKEIYVEAIKSAEIKDNAVSENIKTGEKKKIIEKEACSTSKGAILNKKFKNPDVQVNEKVTRSDVSRPATTTLSKESDNNNHLDDPDYDYGFDELEFKRQDELEAAKNLEKNNDSLVTNQNEQNNENIEVELESEADSTGNVQNHLDRRVIKNFQEVSFFKKIASMHEYFQLAMIVVKMMILDIFYTKLGGSSGTLNHNPYIIIAESFLVCLILLEFLFYMSRGPLIFRKSENVKPMNWSIIFLYWVTLPFCINKIPEHSLGLMILYCSFLMLIMQVIDFGTYSWLETNFEYMSMDEEFADMLSPVTEPYDDYIKRISHNVRARRNIAIANRK